jgi:hypothetical protein
MDKPKFGILETLMALMELEGWHYRLFLDDLFKLGKERPRGLAGDIKYHFGLIRMGISRILLEKRMPMRDKDSSPNWDNFFAVNMHLSQPIKRSDIFPKGTDGISDEKVIEQACDILNPLSVKFNFGPVTTAFDPVEFPEVIDKNLRDMAAKVHKSGFARSVSSCSGHAYSGNGYSRSTFDLIADCNHPKSKVFYNNLKLLSDRFKTENVIPILIMSAPSKEGFASLRIKLNIKTPKDWQENELPSDVLNPEQYLEKLIPGFYKDGGFIDKDVYCDPDNDEKKRQAREYSVGYYKRKNTYYHSDKCESVRDRFWEEVGRIADELSEV